MIEIWKDIKGYEELYQISNFGRVKSFKRRTPIILKQIIGSHGYYTISLHKKGQKVVLVHRLVAEAFIDKIKGKSNVNHKDTNKLNNNYKNLEWCTQLENIIHADSCGIENKGRFKKGDYKKLTSKQVSDIKKDSRSSRKIAKEYGVSKDAILYHKKS